jgi:hypothetical protein
MPKSFTQAVLPRSQTDSPLALRVAIFVLALLILPALAQSASRPNIVLIMASGVNEN